jgi:hypothetical protein
LDYRSEPLVNPSNNENDPSDNGHHLYGDDENDANKEFKRLLCEKIPINDPIWRMRKFKKKEFFQEPYLNIISEITSMISFLSF